MQEYQAASEVGTLLALAIIILSTLLELCGNLNISILWINFTQLSNICILYIYLLFSWKNAYLLYKYIKTYISKIWLCIYPFRPSVKMSKIQRPSGTTKQDQKTSTSSSYFFRQFPSDFLRPYGEATLKKDFTEEKMVTRLKPK